MAAKNGISDNPISLLLFSEPYRFDFFQAVRLLERIYPTRGPVGESGPVSQEVVRFAAHASLDFPPSEIYDLTRQQSSDPNGQPRMVVAFMGLTGPSGVLPTPYTELVIERIRYKDTGIRDFLDLFNHRMISLFYRAWEKYYFPVAYERARENPFTHYLFNVIGMGTEGLQGRLGLPDEALLGYGGLIAQHPHSACAVEAILGDYFGVPVTIQQFSGQWLDIDEVSLSRLGTDNSELGLNTLVGSRFWDRQSRFRVKMGPLTLPQFRAFLPNGSAFPPSAQLTRLLAGLEFDFDLQLILKGDEVPACQLSTSEGELPLLGWTTWLKSQPFRADDPQLVLQVKN
jgi:type VI secretion system protein ImpH